MKKGILIILLLASFNSTTQAQEEGLPPLPGIDEEQFAVYSMESFLVLMGAAVVSFGLAELVFDDENLNFYQVHMGYMRGENMSVFMQNVGLEKRLAPWYAIAVELNMQQWTDGNYKGMGMGLNTYYRWYLMGKKKFSPFIEAGAGAFQGFKKFPEDGSNFTFNLTTKAGFEYTFDNSNRFRVNYGHIHHSNNGLFESNPGFVGNGFTLAYSWRIQSN
jgi:hypothetical protein